MAHSIARLRRYTELVFANPINPVELMQRALAITLIASLWIPVQGEVRIRNSTTQVEAQHSLAKALEGTLASAVVLRLNDGTVLARRGDELADTPGSAIKPLILSWALKSGAVNADTAVYCRRALEVGNRQLPCTHPADQTMFTAQSALAESCNTYFATLATRLRSSDLEAALHSTHLPHVYSTEDSPEQRELTVLGLRGVTATPSQMARAYRELVLSEDADGPVMRGLEDSVRFGMANAARVDGVVLLGKTGTASNAKEGSTHGWFAGILPGKMIFVVYIPHGNGADAARLGGTFVRSYMTAGVQ